jgi:beta-barrel assembly-enhancing protease
VNQRSISSAQHGKAYSAFAFHPKFGGRTAAGSLTIERRILHFKSDLAAIELPLDGLVIRAGGHNSEQIFLQHPQLLDWSVYTSDRSILQDPALRDEISLREQLKALPRSTGLPKWIWVLAAIPVFIIAMLVIAATQKDRLVRVLAAKVPIAWEQKLGQELFDQVKSGSRMIDDPEMHRQIATVTTRLLPVLAGSGYDFEFHVVADTNINAFAIPGGHVVIHTGLLQSVKTPEELAGVLAHEIAHVTQRHAFRKIIESAGLSLIVQTLVGDASGVLAIIAGSSEFLLRQKYSRNFEREADDLGWQYLLSAKINPRGMIDFFSTLKGQEARLPQIPALLSTHPATDDRIQRLEDKWRKLDRTLTFTNLKADPR